MKKYLFFAFVYLVAPAAWCEPVHLICTTGTDSDGNVIQKEISIDEDARKVTIKLKNQSHNAEGFFSANTISFQTATTEDTMMLIQKYEIDRRTLELREAMELKETSMNFSSGGEFKKTGTCEVLEVKDRKI